MSEPTRPSSAQEEANRKAEEKAAAKKATNQEGARRIFTPPETAASEPLAKEDKTRPKWARDLHTELESTYQMLGTVALFASRGDEFKQAAAVNVMNTAGGAADAWVELAEKNPKVKDALLKFTAGTAAAQLISVHFAMFAPLLSAYGLIPSGLGQMILMGSAMEQQAAQNGHVN